MTVLLGLSVLGSICFLPTTEDENQLMSLPAHHTCIPFNKHELVALSVPSVHFLFSLPDISLIKTLG